MTTYSNDAYMEHFASVFEYSGFRDTGVIDGIPSAISILGTESIRIEISIPINKKFRGQFNPANCSKTAEILKDHGLLDIRYEDQFLVIKADECQATSPEIFSEIVLFQVDEARRKDLVIPKGCLSCGNTMEIAAFYENDGICPDCLELAHQKEVDLEEELNRPGPEIPPRYSVGNWAGSAWVLFSSIWLELFGSR